MGIAGRLAKFFLHSQLTPLIALVAMLLGLFAVLVTPREEEPQINVTMASVMIPFPGASAKDVETLVATPAEQVISQIQGLEHVYSVSKPGMAIITAQFKVGVPRTEALVRLYDTIQSNRDWLPRELNVGEPLIKPKGIDDVPVVSLTLWTKDSDRGAYELERVAHAMEAELKRVPGTREVVTLGGPGRLVRVLLDIDKLNVYHLSINDIRQTLLGVNAALPAGQLAAANTTVEVQTGNFLASAKEVGQLVVGVSDNNPVSLSDVARIVDGPGQPSKYVWFGVGKAAATEVTTMGSEFPAVTISITKKPGENAVKVAEQITSRVAELRNTIVPTGVEVSVTRNYGETANDKAVKLIQKLIFATSAVVVLVFFALGMREAAIVGIAVVLTLAATLFASWAWGFTLNRVSLFALIFSIGILVDDAIVVVENIHRHRELYPEKSLSDIIPAAVDEVGGPTILATFTVIAALLPMAFVTGLMGPYMSPIPINASMGMVISLVIAFTVTPWLARRLSKSQTGDSAHATQVDNKLHRWFNRLLLPFLSDKNAVRNRRWLWAGILLAILLSVSLPVAQLVVLKMLPFDNKSEFQVVLDMPVGTPVENTAAALHEMGAYLATIDEVTDFQGYAGTAAPINFNGLVRQYYLRQAPELGDLQVNLVDKHKRSRKSHEIAGAVRATLEEIAARHGAKVKVVEVPPGPPVMSPLVAEIYGPDEAGRHALAKQVRQAFGQTPDIIGIDDSIEDNAQKVVLRVDQRKAALLGIPATDVVQAMRVALNGEDITSLHDGQSKYSIPVQLILPPEKQARLNTLLTMTVKSGSGDNVPLSELVKVQPTTREKTIYHKNMLPVTYVIGDMAGKLDSPLYGMFEVRSKLGNLTAAQGAPLGEYFINQPSDPYRQFSLKWDGEWQITYETFRDMGLAYAVGLVLVYILVVAQFGSYLTPLIIMAPIPLTIIGVMPGHALLGSQYTATSMIGMIALAGIIVRNSILLVDFINLQVAQGMPFVEAVIHSASARAKPIVLTGLAAMIGALFILDDPIFNGLAISLIFGIFVSTLLTLVVIPVLYYAANRKKFS
ncbi:MAG: efflux RND transporter permease subunit [Polaromonas sp.]|uniref:efflux RND transporter permease subunit n=1 Tax=Polaromonas sp. TaxID=1869339 RepID=UPI00184E6451|nr:efflux RND transporter permease subunit [Polaromonas sp.]NMM10854.1 efflux RND transporter permease subunit [Polaromonas sp.]